ncbi:MAG TPA: hypothetical protein VF952_07455 [Chloroflexia bacterium]|jgi:hypothetical protein
MNGDTNTTSDSLTEDTSVDAGAAPTGTINIYSGSITFTLQGRAFNTVALVFAFDSEQVGTAQLQPPSLKVKGQCGDTSGSFDYNLTLQPPSGQINGSLTANSLTVTPANQDPVILTGTSLVTWDNQGNILSQYGN